MAIFAIIPRPDISGEKLPKALAEQFKDDFTALEGDHGWLVSAKGTAKDLSDKLGITSGENGGGVVLEVSSYFGRSDPNLWSWMKTKLEEEKDA